MPSLSKEVDVALSFADVPVGTYFTWNPCGCRLRLAGHTVAGMAYFDLMAPCAECDPYTRTKSRMLARPPRVIDYACSTEGDPYPRRLASTFRGTIDYLVTELAK